MAPVATFSERASGVKAVSNVETRTEPVYVAWEPGIGSANSLPTNPLVARVVAKVPEVADVKSSGVAAEWFESPAVSNLMAVRDRKPADPATRVAILRDATHLFVAFDCVEPSFATLHRLVPRDAKGGELKVYSDMMARSLEHDDHVEVRVDSAHDHVTSARFVVNVNGARRATKLKTYMSWAAIPVVDDEQMADDGKWESEVHELPDRWRCAIKIELAALGVDLKKPTVGLHLGRARYGDCLRQFVSAPTLHGEHAAPLAFNDLYLSDKGVTVENIAWRERVYDANHLTVSVRNSGAARKVRVAGAVKGGGTFESEVLEVSGGETVDIELEYDMPQQVEISALSLELKDAGSGELLFQSNLPMSNHSQLNIVRSSEQCAVAENPEPSDPDFHAKKIRYVQARLPKFVRRNTAQGAPSDFTLQSEDGEVVFNLMEAGVMDRIGKWIDSLFDNAIDRVVACALFSNDNAVTTHCAARVSMHQELTALSALRLGAGHCYSRALGGAGIVGAVADPRTGKRFEAYPVLVVGHVVVAIRWRDGWTFIDPSFGTFLFNKDNTDLATDRELEADHSLIHRACSRKHALYNYGRRDVHVRFEEGTVVWPAGAPAW